MARTSYKRSSRPTGRKRPNVVGNLHTAIQSPRVKPEGDRGKKMILSLPGFFSFSSFPGLTGESVREMSSSRPNMTKKKTPLPRGFSENQGNSGDQAGSEASAGVTIIRSLYPVKSIEYSLTGALLREFPLSWRKYINTRPFGDQVGPSTR